MSYLAYRTMEEGRYFGLYMFNNENFTITNANFFYVSVTSSVVMEKKQEMSSVTAKVTEKSKCWMMLTVQSKNQNQKNLVCCVHARESTG